MRGGVCRSAFEFEQLVFNQDYKNYSTSTFLQGIFIVCETSVRVKTQTKQVNKPISFVSVATDRAVD